MSERGETEVHASAWNADTSVGFVSPDVTTNTVRKDV